MKNTSDIPIILLSRDHTMDTWFVFCSILSYLAVIINIFVFCVLCQKRFVSPATVLLQCLAVADGLTALFTYGFEPFFYNRFTEVSNILHSFNGTYVTIYSPYCKIYVYVVLLACDCFHLMSIILTTCIGFQKVIALKFPIWTRTSLTVNKVLIVSFLCFVAPIAINLPILNSHSYKDGKSKNVDVCLMSSNNKDKSLERYFHRYQPIITSVLLTSLCLLMIIASIYITYKLCTNKFRKQLNKNERRSIVMVYVLLLTVLVSEVPRIIASITYIVVIRKIKSTLDDFDTRVVLSGSQQDRKFFSFLFAIREDSDYLHTTDHDLFRSRAFFETVKILTVLACMSNIFIYIIMSERLRLNLKSMFTKVKQQSSRTYTGVKSEINHVCNASKKVFRFRRENNDVELDTTLL